MGIFSGRVKKGRPLPSSFISLRVARSFISIRIQLLIIVCVVLGTNMSKERGRPKKKVQKQYTRKGKEQKKKIKKTEKEQGDFCFA
jgi:hypothetical protein